jgi:putative inorganic carbon (hco3(-)) transporter
VNNVATQSSSSFTNSLADSFLLAWSRLLQILSASSPVLFFACLTAMLFRPPDLPVPAIDHIALMALLVAVALKTLCGGSIAVPRRVTFPLGCLVALSFAAVVRQPFQSANWSVWVAKWMVPLAFFIIAGMVFEDRRLLRHLEIFLLLILGYLALTAVFFMLDLSSFIFPAFILDDSIGIHADRARGPFLQAVANGMTINILALIAIDSFRRRRLRGVAAIALLASIPLAIFATLTRAVWICFAFSIAAAAYLSHDRRVRTAAVSFAISGIAAACLYLVCSSSYCRYGDRLEERSPVDFRVVMFRTGLEMFFEKPLLGWNAADVQPELADRVSDFRQREYFFHNTYLETAVYHGLAGLALYIWMLVDLFRIGAERTNCNNDGLFLDNAFRWVWPVILAVYLINASFVVMNYQFVNALLFSLAGILAAQNRRAGAGIRSLNRST